MTSAVLNSKIDVSFMLSFFVRNANIADPPPGLSALILQCDT